MNKRAREFIVKLFSLILAITMSIPTNVFASSGTKKPKEMPTVIRLADSGGGEDTYIEDTTEDTYIEEGEKVYSEYIEETNPAETAEFIEEAPQEEALTIAEEDSRNYILSQKARLNDNHDGIIYDIKVAKKEKSYHDPNNKLSLSLMLNQNQDLKDIKLTKVVIDGKEEKRDDKSNKQGDIQSLNLISPSFEKEITYTVEASIDKKAIDTNKLYSMDLSLDIGQFNLILQRISYKFVEYEKEDKTKELKLTHIKEAEDALSSISYKKDDGDVDKVIYTDYIISKDKGDEESRANEKNKINYAINLENLKNEDTEISLDYYKADDKGFNIKKEFSANLPYQEKLDLDIPASYILKLTVTSKTDKKNTKIESHKINGREVKSPRFVKEEEKSSDDDEEAAKKAEEEKKAAEEKAKAEERRKAEEAKKAEAEKQAEAAKKAEEEAKSATEKKEAEEKAKREQEAKEAKEKETSDKLQAEKEDLLKALKEKSPSKDEENKAKTEVKEDSNLSKADAELKAALADKTKGIEDIQNLLTSLGEKYKLTREDQAKLMTANDAAIKALVEKDRKENFRPNVLAKVPSDSFKGKKFHLNTVMKVKASDAWPIPSGWYFDVNLGPYLKEDIGQRIEDLHHPKLGLVATAQMLRIGNDNIIRYTYVKKITEPIELKIDQDLEFDADTIGGQNPITLNIKVAPKNNPVQNLYPITVSKDTDSPVKSSYIVEDEGETQSGTYPYQLNWKTTSQKLRDKNHNEIKSMIDPKLDGAYVDWDIEVDTKDLINSKETLDFDKLHLTVFGSANQGIKEFSFKASTSPISVDDTSNFKSSSRLGEILTQDSDIKKSELGDKLYIKVRGKIDPDQVHETYSIGFRINPDKNYIDNLLQEYKDKFDKIPSPIKWLKGVKEAKRFAEVPFNLVETMIPATFNGLRDKFTNERFYYDNTRTIVADRKSDKRADWYALDLIRRGENQDSALDYPTFDINNGTDNQNIKADKIYFVPRKDGGYRRTSQAGDVVLSNGQYYPGTIVSYEYENEKGQRNDAYNFRADLKDKKKFNIDEVYDTEGGMINLFTQKVSDQAIANGYLAYTEDPYPIMRIDKNFDMVSCFNDRIKAPIYTGNNSVILDKHEDVPGDFLISRLNESINKKSGDYELKKYLNGTEYDGVFLNHDGMSEGQAMEELMKKIYFYGEEVKKDYSKKHGGKEMHRLIESSMYQRVIHHFTDGKSLEQDYFQAPSSYNVDEWKVDHTLQGTRQAYPKTGWDDSFDGKDISRKINNEPGAPRKLKDNETRIANYPPVQSTQYEMAQALYKKVIDSYREGNDWNPDKADSVKLVFYSHTDEGKYQELIAGRVMAPIEIDKYKQDGKKLAGAEFRFTNIDTGENKTWTSKDDENTHKLYLRPGKYKVQEIKTPDGYQTIEDFDIEVIREEINKDDGPYRAKKLDSIHVNDGFKTKVKLGDNIPETADHQKLVELDGNNIKVKIKNIDDNLGSLEFTKKNKFIRLRGAEFRLRKLKDTSLDKAKKDINSLTDEDFDSNKYDQRSAGDGGDFKFEQIPVGYFVLEETNVPTGYQKAPLYLLQGVKGKDDKNKDTVIVGFVGNKDQIETENNKTIIRNKPKETDVEFRKIREALEAEDKDKLGLSDARFRLESLWTKDGSNYYKDLTSKYPKYGSKNPLVGKGTDEGYFRFEKLLVGDYKLTEIQAPYGYQVTDSYWRLEVRENEKGNLTKTLYEVKKDGTEEKVDLNKDSVYQITNKARKTNVEFKKYLGELEKDSEGNVIKDKDGKPIVKKDEVNKKLNGENNQPVSFDLYSSDFYGAIIGDKDEHGNIKPIKTGIIQDDQGLFHLNDLEFGKYYILRETNPPAGYEKANDILLKVEAEAVANVGQMKVIVRDPNANTEFGEHAIFKGVIDFKKGEQLGSFSIKKTGRAIYYLDENGKLVTPNPQTDVGLRRAYFRLYTANRDFSIEKNAGGYPKEYIQKVTPGVPIILYLTEAEAKKMTDADRKNLGIVGYKNFTNNHGDQESYAVDKDGKRFRIGQNPNNLPENQGIVTFDNLKPGYYVLEEFRGPAGYERTTQKWYVKVDEKGRTIRSENKNDPAFNGQGLQSINYFADPSSSTRFRMANLDISEPLQFNRPMQPASNRNVRKEKSSLDVSDNYINDRVSAGESDVEIGNTYTNEIMGKNSGTSQIEVTTYVEQLPNDEFKVTVKTKLLQGSGVSGFYEFSFNNDFDFVRNSTHSDRVPTEPAPYNGRWHNSYNASKNSIDVDYGQPRLKKNQTAIIEFNVTPKDKSKLKSGQAYSLFNEITYKPNNGFNTLVYKLRAPTVTYKQIQNITYKEETVLIQEIPIPTTPIRRENSSMYKGEEKTVFKGAKGKVEERRKYKYIDGVKQENDYQVIERITTDAQAPIIEYGTKTKPVDPEEPGGGEQPSQGDKNLEVNFTYSNSVNGKKVAPDNTSPGRIVLEEVNGTSSQELEKLDAVNEGRLSFTTKLDSKKSYRLVYTRKDNLAKAWALPNQSIYNIDSKSMKADIDTVKVNIANGNTMDIFNVDETGFRIPLRVTKVNENKGVLTGAQFKARKLLKGDPISKVGEEKVYPKYYDEAYDGVSEATGLPGDNYFRELSPGIYELEEIKTPNETYRLPKDENGKEKKWYFKVQVAKDENGNYKKPSDDGYMEISFHFEETLPKNSKDERWAIPEGERDDLLGKEIKGIDFGTINGKQVYDHFTEIIKDNHRSDPARPDAPYKGIDDVRVTNYLKTTELSFTKKDLASYENIEGAEFTLKRAKLDKNGDIIFGLNGNPQVEDFEEKTKDSSGKEVDKFVKPKPYDDKLKAAKATSSKSSGLHFTNIEQGTYILEETKPADGYKLEDNFLAIKFTTDEKGAWKQEITAYQKDGNGYKKVENAGSLFQKDANKNLDIVFNNKSYIGLKFQKIEGKKKDGEEVPVKSADFKLTQVDKNGKKIEGGYEKTIYSYDNSVFEFKYLPVGHYKLQETRAISKFEKPDPWFFEVKQDDKTHKLKIVFKNHDASVSYTPIDQSEYGKNSPVLELDEETKLERPKDLKIRNYSKTNFSFQKLKNEIDEKTKEKLPLKDAYFRLTKVRFSMDEKAKSYEYHNEKDGAGLKKYVHGKKVTEYDPKGNVEKFTYDNKEYKYDENKNLISVGGQTPTEEDKKVKPDAISNATGKYSALRRSQSTGRVDFQNLGEGIYQLEEVGIPEGYQSDTKQFKWIFKVEKTDDGLQVTRKFTDKTGKEQDLEEEYFKKYDNDYYQNVYLKNKFNENSNIEEGDKNTFSYKITNAKTTTDLKWKKIGSRSTDNLVKKDTKFVLLKTSDNPEDINSAKDGQTSQPPYQVESTDGTFEIKDLSKGVYTLIETQAPEGYEKMTRKIAIKVYEDTDGSLKKKFYEITDKNELVENAGSFEALLNRNVTNPEVHTEKDGTFYVINKSKPYYFYLRKGFMENNQFKDIKKGKLRVKIYADPKDTKNTDKNVYEQTIDLSDAGSYRIDLTNDIQLGRDYILEEVESPDGFAKTKYKYKLRFAYNSSWETPFVATLVAVLDEKGEPLKNDRGNISDSGQYLGNGQSINSGFPFRIVNKKTEVEFTKFGEDEKAKDGKKPLEGVKFYLEKQDPDDIQKENHGYYPLTKDMKYIKSEVGRDKLTHYYIEEDGKKTWFTGLLGDTEVKPETHRGIYKSDSNGKFKITDLTDGYYRVIEPEAPEYEKGKKYMKVNGPIKTFRVVNGRVMIYTVDNNKTIEKEVDGTSEATVTHIINDKPGKGEFELTKVDENDGPLKDVEFTLYKTDGETQVGEKQTTGSDGKIKFTGLPYGYYWLKETKTKDGYILDTKKKLISLGGDKEWKVPDKQKDDVSKSIIFDGKQEELVSTADKPNSTTVYPNKAEGIFAKYKFKIDEKTIIKPGDYFTIKFSDNVDLDGIDKNNSDIGQKGDQYFNIIGPAGLLAKAKVNDDRRSITYTFTEYVKDYKPESMSMFLQLFPNRRKVDHTQDIEVTADIGHNTDTTNPDYSKYHYSDSINIDYRGYNDKGRYNGYQNPKSDISSYMLRLDPEHKTFTAIVYYNPWNKYLTNKNITFTADEDIIQNSLSVKTYRKSGWGSHRDGWEEGDLPDSYDVDFYADNLKYISDFYRYEPIGNTGNTRKIYIPNENLTQNGYNTNTYVIEIKGQLAGKDVKSLKTRVEYEDHNVYSYNQYYKRHYYENTYTGNFETWSQFFNPGASGNVNKEIKLVNFKNKIEFAKVDGGVLSNVVDKEAENPNTLKDLGIGNPLKGAEFKLVKDGTDVDKSTRTSDENGIFSWEGLAPGNYEVIETKTPDDKIYDLPKDAISSFEVDKDGNIVNVKENKQILENYRKSQIRIRKTDQDGEPLAGAKFTLTPKSGQKNPDKPSENYPAYTYESNKDGIVEFKKLPAGKYDLEETKAPDGYTKTGRVYYLEVTRDGKVKWENSFYDSYNNMKIVDVNTYTGQDQENIRTKIVGIYKENKKFRQIVTIKAKSSELEKSRLILESKAKGISLSQANTEVRVVQYEGDQIKAKDNSTYTVDINNGESPNLTIRINPPYRNEDKNKPVGSSGSTSQEKNDVDIERTYKVIVDMPYGDDETLGAKVSYDIGKISEKTGKVEFTQNDQVKMVDKYAKKNDYFDHRDHVSPLNYETKYLQREMNLVTTDIANIKQPDIYLKKVDADYRTVELAGAEFELQKMNGKTIESIRKATSDKDGNFGFEGLKDGNYQIVETKSPTGYVLSEKTVYKFKVAWGKIYKVGKESGVAEKKELLVGEKKNSKDNRIEITNKKAQYPYTGGPGTWLGFTILGALTMTAAGIYLAQKKKYQTK